MQNVIQMSNYSKSCGAILFVQQTVVCCCPHCHSEVDIDGMDILFDEIINALKNNNTKILTCPFCKKKLQITSLKEVV